MVKMGLHDYFKPVSTWSVEKVRELVAERDPGEYVLVDVRQPKEYERGHIPGARLIPLSELEDRMDELERGKPVITY